VQVIYRKAVVAAYHAAFKERESRFDTVGSRVAIHPNLCAVVHCLVLDGILTS
jgi:hypothetical protein